MIYFINKEKTSILGYDPMINQVLYEYKAMTRVENEVNPSEEIVVKKRRGRQPKPGYGDKSRDIEICIKEGLSVKETIGKLKKKYPTITSMDVYVCRSKMKKAQSSDVFSGPTKTIDEKGKTEMIQKYGQTAVNKVIELSLAGYKTEAIAHHHEVRLIGEQVEEIIRECM